ncbi:MAG: ShlB/FhaC/HecB family hemolysin secretion/activation protein [Comamonadaceae bacterium]|nr:MAG: ShlB/FhaC/HecB family hemolysin secretion/activation protein [Comamonadaceae bacterium]
MNRSFQPFQLTSESDHGERPAVHPGGRARPAASGLSIASAVSLLCALAGAMAAVPQALAQAAPPPPPDAGRVLRDVQAQPLATVPGTVPTLLLPADADVIADAGLRFKVSAMRIEGNTLIPSAELLAAVGALAGREYSLAELRKAAARITALYRERGYLVARAYLPAQEISDGVVLVQVLEGRLGESTVANQSIVGTPVIEAVIRAQGLAGQPLRAGDLDRELLLVADLPGAGAVSGNLKPGLEVGGSDLFVAVEPGKRSQGQITADNHGNRYTGQKRLGGALDINSPFAMGDRLSLRGTVTDEALLYGQASYDVPVNGDGLRAGAVLSTSHYDLGAEFARLEASGVANTAGLYATYPLVRGVGANVWIRAALNHRQLKDEVRAVALAVDKSADAFSLDLYGDLQDHADKYGGGAYNTWRLSLVAGKLDIETPLARQVDEAGPRTGGGYRKFEFAASRLQAITAQTSAYAAVAGQWAGKNLDSSEKFAIGGIYGVRAYPQGEGVGDSGWLANLELRQELPGQLQGSVFYDYGHVTYNQSAYAAGQNNRDLKGYGVALGARQGAFDARATLAWRSGPQATSAPDRNPRLWLMGRWTF